MTPQQAINQLKRDGFSDEEIIEAVLPMVRDKYAVINCESKPPDFRLLEKGTWIVKKAIAFQVDMDLELGQTPTFDRIPKMAKIIDCVLVQDATKERQDV